MISKNQIYTALTNALSGVYCTQYYEEIPQALPCVYFRESHAPVSANIDLDLADEQLHRFVYIEVYGSNLDSLVSDIESAMKTLKFTEELCEMIPNYDPTIERVSMRFTRVIGGGDTL